MQKLVLGAVMSLLLLNCGKSETKATGFSLQNETNNNANEPDGLRQDSLNFDTQPRNVLLTANGQHRLVPIYKVNFNKKTKEHFTGTNRWHYRPYGQDALGKGNYWANFMPGMEAVYGHNMVNISYFNTETLERRTFFDHPVLINTLYYPSNLVDTLNYKPVRRNFYMVSV